jgi:hypothetical protein
MRIRLFALLVLSSFAISATPEHAYLAKRDTYIAQFRPMLSIADQQDQRALSKLQVQLRKLLGVVTVPGFAGKGAINLQTLQQDGGFGQLDGLNFPGDKERLFVSNVGLLETYLASHARLPDQIGQALRTDAFYSTAFSWNVAVMRYADLPIKTHGAVAGAFLALNAQDIGAYAPNGITVWVLASKPPNDARAARFYKVSATLADDADSRAGREKLDYQIPLCLKNWQALPVNGASNLVQEEAFAAYRACYAENLASQPFFAQLQRRAQNIVDRLLAEK